MLTEDRSELLQFGVEAQGASPIRRAIQNQLFRLRDYFACPNVGTKAREEYQNLRQEIGQLKQQIERMQGEERMRAGMFGDLGRPWNPRKRRGPSCRRVWVRGYTR